MSDLTVAIDARLQSGVAGGVESMVLGLASGLSRLEADGPERYLFFAYDESVDWLAPFLAGPCSILSAGRLSQASGIASRSRSVLRRSAPRLYAALSSVPVLAGLRIPPPARSDGRIERAGADVMHFMMQGAFLTAVPNIYHPHDLQHVHLPQFFSHRQRAIRESRYRVFCRQAAMVAVASSWTRWDLIAHYGLDPEKVRVMPWAPIVTEYPTPTELDLRDASKRLRLPDRFILYPAQTWPHKNHIALLEALALTKAERGMVVPLVACGHQNDFFRILERRAQDLGLADQVRWTGFVTPLELQCLYRLATAVVVPTKFEAMSGPVAEAFATGRPVACSNVTSLPGQVGDAALLFDPDDPSQIADAIARLWTDAGLRELLIHRGLIRASSSSWGHAAQRFRAEYRRIAGRALSEQDRAVLAEEPAT
jgi:glycosyltransferase involved in cell wall biosynthesis